MESGGVLMCVECEDTAAALRCLACEGDVFCGLCWMWIHRKGNRSNHSIEKLSQVEEDGLKGITLHFTHAEEGEGERLGETSPPLPAAVSASPLEHNEDVTADLSGVKPLGAAGGYDMVVEESGSDAFRALGTLYGSADSDSAGGAEVPFDAWAPQPLDDLIGVNSSKVSGLAASSDDLRAHLTEQSAKEARLLVDRCRFIPVRMTAEERDLLRLLDGALSVSEYTDNVDVADSDYGSYRGWGNLYSYSKPLDRDRRGDSRLELIEKELNEIFNVISGYYVSANPGVGGKIIKENDVARRILLLQRIFEIGRRYKIMNPDRMRYTYGKMMWMLQDASKSGLLSFSLVTPIKTVYSELEEKGGLRLLTEGAELLLVATREVSAVGKSREAVAREVALKSAAVEEVVRSFATPELPAEQLKRLISSVADNSAFVAQNRVPVDATIDLLTSYFSPREIKPSLELRYGRGGSRLNHDHRTQYTFVLQSLLLWREILGQLMRLWFMADSDLLSPSSSYRLRETGQGLNRVQACPNVGGAMASILGKVQGQVRGWVGLSVVHLGDRDVPNALVYIDKYVQHTWPPKGLSPQQRSFPQGVPPGVPAVPTFETRSKYPQQSHRTA